MCFVVFVAFPPPSIKLPARSLIFAYDYFHKTIANPFEWAPFYLYQRNRCRDDFAVQNR